MFDPSCHAENEILDDIMELEMNVSLNEWKLVLKRKGLCFKPMRL